MLKNDKWEDVYRDQSSRSLPRDLGKPHPALFELIENKKKVPKVNALDICCGIGTNTLYLAEAGSETIGMDVSDPYLETSGSNEISKGVSHSIFTTYPMVRRMRPLE